MKFDYKEMETVSEGGYRLYLTPNGDAYPSITTVLGNTMPEEKAASLKAWQNSLGAVNAAKKTQEACDHGTAVHLLIERHLKGEELVQAGEKFEHKSISAFNAIKLKLKAIEELWAQEVPLYSDVIGVAGRTDCIGVWKGKPSIIDFKTSSRIKSDKEIYDYKLQLCAYAIMHNEMFGTDIEHGVILMTAGDGFPLSFNVNLNEFVDPLMERVDAFYKRLTK